MKKFLRFLMLTALLLPFALQAQVSLPFSMDFENAADLNQWTMTNCLSNTGISSSYAHEGSNSFRFYYTTNPPQYLISPEFDVATGTEMISFWYANFSTYYDEAFEVGFSSTTNNVTDFTWLPSVAVPATPWTEYTAMVPAGTKYVAIKSTAYDAYHLYIDDIYIGDAPSCFKVTNVTFDAAQTTSNSLTLTWTDVLNSNATYNIYNMSDNTIVASNINDTTYTIDNLSPNTLYTFGIETDCGGGDLSAGYASVSGRTACGIETMPWSENFDTWTFKSDCWSFLSGAYNGGNGTPTEYSSAWTLNSSYGTYITISGNALTMNLYNTLKYWAVTPPIEITNDDAMLSVDVAVSAWSSATPNYDDNDTLAFAISTDNGNTFTNLRVVNNTELNALNGEYTTLYIPVTGYNGQTVRFAIYGGSISGTSPHDNRIAIDNVTVSDPIDCMPVSGLSVSNITSTGATLTWEGNADGYTIWNMADTTVDQYATDVTADLYALDPNTHYTFGVTANCGSEESMVRTISFTTLVSCPAPTNLAATLTPGDGSVASLSWDNNGTEAWQLCFNGDTNNLIDITDNPYELTNLTPEQTYTAMVRAYCDVDDQSAWSNTITFTPTDAYSITVNDGTTTNSYVPIYGTYVDEITKSQFIIPAVNLAAMQFGTINKLTFYASNENVSWGAAQFEVYLTETSETTLSNLADYSGMTQVYAGSLSISNNKMEVTFTTPYIYLGGNLMIGFLQTATGTWSSCNWHGTSATGASMGGYGTGINQQNFLPKTTIDYTPGDADICLPATGLTVSNITTDGATLTWNGEADGYTIYDMSDTTVYQYTTDNTVDLYALDPMTHYTFGVAANCGSEESMIVSVSFNTACSAVELPYTETFDATSGTRNCWDLVATGNIGGTYGMGFVTVDNREVIRFSSYSNATDYNQYGYSPLMEVSSSATNLLVNVVYATYGSNDVLNFGYVTATDTIWDSTDYTTTGQSDWQTLEFVIPVTATQLAVHYYGNYSYYGWIDNVSVTEMTGDYCYPVTDLTVDSTTSNSVFLSWTDNNNTATYTIYNGTTIVATNIAATEYEVTGLSSSTNYTFGVAADCSADNESSIRTVSASTECGTVDQFPYVQDFSAEPACWTKIDADGDGYNWTILPGYTSIQSASYDNDEGALTPDNWLVSPQFAIPSGSNYEVTWSATAQDQSWPAEHYGIFISTTGNTNTSDFTMIDEWTLSAGTFNPVIDLSTYAGQNIYIALRHFNCTDQFRLSIDDFTVREQAGANQVTINVTQNNPAYGTVTGAGIYNIGDSVTVTATPAASYTFSKWVDENLNIISTDNPYTFVATTNLTLNAIFLDNSGATHTITVLVNDSLMGTATGGGTYPAGEQIILSATANAGYQFVNWTQESSYGINEVGTDPDLIITVTGDKTFIANFEPAGGPVTTYTVTLNTADATMGTVAPAGANTVNEGSSFTATATALDGYHFVAWMNGTTQVSTANPYTFNVTADITLTATFEANTVTTHTVTLNTADATMGTVAPAGASTVNEGSSFTATATALDGYHFVAWMNGTTQVSTANPYTFTVTGDITLTATFEANDPAVTYYNVSVTSANTEMGNVTSSHSGQVAENTEVTATATPAANYRFVNWTNDAGTEVSTANPYTFTVTADITLIANFEIIDNIDDVTLSQSVMLMPNPADNYIDLNVNSNVNVKEAMVYNAFGQMIQKVALNDNHVRIDLSNMAAGMYFVRVNGDNVSATKKFIKR